MTTTRRLVVSVDPVQDDRRRVRAPAVGWWSNHPRAQSVLEPGAPVGLLRCLNRRFLLRLPDDVGGTVEAATGSRVVAVEYGQTLFHLVRSGDAGHDGGRTWTTHETAQDCDLAPGTRAVRSPTDGVFYRRPAPDAAPFVQPGQRVRRGQPLGLVEVMKTFNQIVYGGTGLPDEAEVVEIRCSDAEEVGAGQVLIIVR